MKDLLPPRLPDPGATPLPGDVPELLSRARKRRRRRLESAMCVPLVMGLAVGGLQAVSGGNGESQVRTVEPATERGIDRVEGFDDLVEDLGGPAAVAAPPARAASAGPEPSEEPEEAPHGTEPEDPKPRPRPDTKIRYTTIDREIVADRPLEPCSTIESRDNRVAWCGRYAAPAEVPSGRPVDFRVEYCPRDGDGVLTVDTAQEVAVAVTGSSGPGWVSLEDFRKATHEIAVPAGSCMRWTVHWDGRYLDRDEPMAPGRYDVSWFVLREGTRGPLVGDNAETITIT